jgi:hypothetical protein
MPRPKYCWTHKMWRRYGPCPKCLELQARQELYHAFRPAGLIGPYMDWEEGLIARMTQLIGNPVDLNQDCFGICGMACAVYVLLQHASDKAWNLFDASFADLIPGNEGIRFRTALHGPRAIKIRDLIRRYKLQQQRAANIPGGVHPAEAVFPPPAAVQASPVQLQQWRRAYGGFGRPPGGNYTFFVDYCICRGLGYLMKQIAGRRYVKEKKQFVAEFTPPGIDYKAATRFGTLALRTNNLAFILIHLLGADNVNIACKTAPAVRPANWGPQWAHAPLATDPTARAAVVPRAHYETFQTLAQLTALFNANLTPGRFAVAGVFADLCRNTPINAASARAAGRPQLTFSHWVVIEAYQHVPPDVTLTLWTWQRRYNVTVNESVFLSYIQDVIFGRLPP